MLYTESHLHQAGVLVGREAVDVLLPLWVLGLQEAGEASLDVVGAGDLLLPVIHVDLQHLQVGTEDRPGCEGGEARCRVCEGSDGVANSGIDKSSLWACDAWLSSALE